MTTTWQFEGTNMWFTSPTATLEKSILTYRKVLNNYESKIIYQDGTNNNTTTADATGSNGDTTTEVVPTVSLDTGEIEADEQEALRLRDLFSNVGGTTAAPDGLENVSANGHSKFVSNGMVRKRNG